MANNDEITEKIDNGEFTIFDKFLYGGIGYGYICLPKNTLRVLLSFIFPPFSIILHHLEIKDTFPYITKNGIINLYNNLGDVVYSIFLTCLFWIPGFLYSLQKIKFIDSEYNEFEEKFENTYGFSSNKLTNKDIKEFMKKKKNNNKFNI